jgi:arylsulfatase A-like enzyme
MPVSLKAKGFWPLIISSLGGFISGIFFGEWNIILEVIKGKSIFRLRDLVSISLWHGIIGLVAGLAVGLIWIIVLFVKRTQRNRGFLACFIIFTYFAAWIFIQGFINIYLFAGILHQRAILVNAAFFILALTGFILLNRSLGKRQPGFNKFWKGYFSVHALILMVGLVILFIPARSRSELIQAEFSPKPSSGASFRNVVLVIWDALRADHLSCYGYPLKTSPNLDKLASQGILFEQAIAASSHTVESIPSLLSSTLPTSHQMNDITSYLPPELVIMPQVFKALGYNTVAFSFNPYFSPVYGYKKGLDRFFAPGESSIKVNKTILGHILESSSRVPVVSDLFKPAYLLSKRTSTVSFGETELTSTGPEIITNKIINWIDNHPQNPFFILAHLEGGHAPYLAPPSLVETFWPEEQLPEPEDWPTVFPRSLGLFLPFREGPSLSQDEIKKMVSLYDAKIYYHDYWLGQLLNYFKQEDKLKNTLFLLTADHGEEFYDHHGWGHGHSLYQELIRVPLIISGEGFLPSGIRIQNMVSLLDVFPTLVSLLGVNELINFPYSLEGEDLSIYLRQAREPEKKEPICSELNQGSRKARALIDWPWKIIIADIGSEEVISLYNLSQDPAETRDLSQALPEEKDRLLTSLKNVLNLSRKKVFQSPRRRVSQSEKERLRSLGYID